MYVRDDHASVGIFLALNNHVSPGQIYIPKTVLSDDVADPYFVLFCLRLATINQICDPWIYILCQESRLRRVD